MWRQHGDHGDVETTGDNVETMWGQHGDHRDGDNMETTWEQHEDKVDNSILFEDL